MPYIARRQMIVDGKQLNGGDVVPAENWPTRRSLISCGRLEFVAALPEKIDAEIPEESRDQLPEINQEKKLGIKNALSLLAQENEAKIADSMAHSKSIPLTSMRVADIKKSLLKITDLEQLNQLLEQETKGKNRASATVAVENRIKAVKIGLSSG